MALTLLRFFETTKTPLLPVVAVVVPVVVCGVADKMRNDRAVAATMPPSTEDYVWTYTETGEATLRPVVVAVDCASGNRGSNVAGAF